MPVNKFETPDFAPEFTLREDLVREPDAGIPDRKAQPMLPMPNEKASLSLSILFPHLDAKDLPIDRPSIKQSNERATEVCRITCQCFIESSK
tara:strand:- start:94 stop:369 length:276 start_codon:yes stop_codon:yes gene_type:complete